MDMLPHDDGLKPPWPSPAMLQSLRDGGIRVSHFLLLPGEYVHINKVRCEYYG